MRFDSIEGLRAPLAWWVVVAHLLRVSEVGRDSLPASLMWLHVGIIPVCGFIVVSGLVIANLIDFKQEQYLPYITRRYFRLAPLMIFTMLLAYVLSLYGLWEDWPDDNVALRIFLQITLMHGVIPDTQLADASMTFMKPGWTISLEWQFYLVAPFLVFALKRGGLWIAPILLWLLIALVSTSGADLTRINLFGIEERFAKPSQLLSALHLFLIGVLIFFVVKNVRLPKHTSHFGLIAIAALCFYWMGSDRVFRWMVLPLAGFVAYLVLFSDSRLTRAFEWKPLTYLGRISYSTYLLHFFVVHLSAQYFYESVGPGWELFWLMTAVSLPLTLLVSILGYHLVEQPFMRLGSALATKLTRSG